jgi:hypothetical protein
MLSVVMLSVYMLSVIMLSVIMLSIVMLNVVASCNHLTINITYFFSIKNQSSFLETIFELTGPTVLTEMH